MCCNPTIPAPHDILESLTYISVISDNDEEETVCPVLEYIGVTHSAGDMH